MTLKLLVFILLAYWIVRVAMNLGRAIVRDEGGGAFRETTSSFSDEPVKRKVDGQVYAQTWHVSRPERMSSRRPVEDARFHDVPPNS
ncbi:MAG: hypothetical protein ACOCSK_01755 [Rhodothermales bacterium]